MAAGVGAVGALALAMLIGLAAPLRAADPSFDSYWHDGKAELDGYRLELTRYGAPRPAQAVMIYVTEPFSISKHVKLDDPSRSPQDVVDVLKLNLVRDFQTGIYDYNTMVSLFVRTSDLEPLKVSFTSAEWCGNVYEELIFDPRRVSQRVFSYFEGETGATTLPRPVGGITEDELFVRLRGLRGPLLEPGQRRSVPFLASPFFRRLNHAAMVWGSVEIARAAGAERVEVPAGTFPCDVYRVRTTDGRSGVFHVERAYPHRIVRWQWRRMHEGPRESFLGATETGQLAGTSREKYWEEHGVGDEKHLMPLGIQPTVR